MNYRSDVKVWLGQSVDTSSICGDYQELRTLPFLTSLGCAIRRPSLRRTHLNANLRAKLSISGPLMIDSGGFALSINPHAAWSWKQVAEAIDEIDADIFVTLDIPPHATDSGRERKQKIRASVQNYERLLGRFPGKVIMPVVHGRTRKEVEYCLNLIWAISTNPTWIGVGGVVPLLQRRRLLLDWDSTPEAFIAMSINATRSKFTNSKIHVFGAGGTRTFPALVALGADSADSIGWRQAAGFGSIFLPLKSQRTVLTQSKAGASRKILDASEADDLMRCGCPICQDVKSFGGRVRSFKRNFHNRAIHNAWVVANQFFHWPRSKPGLMRLVVKGALGQDWAHAAREYGSA